MVDELTEHARAALARSRDIAAGRGGEAIQTVDLLHGLIATEGCVASRALGALGVTSEALHQGEPRPAPGAPPPRLAVETKGALEAARHRAVVAGHLTITTGHLLLAITEVADGPAALKAAGADPAAVAGAVAAQHATAPPEDAPRPMGAVLDDIDRWAAPRMALSRVYAWLFDLLWYAATIALMARLFWPDLRPAAYVVLAGPAALIAVIGALPAAGEAVGKRLARLVPVAVPVPERVRAALAARGVTSLEIRVSGDSGVGNHSARLGRRAWVVLSARTLGGDGSLRFIFAHELAHVLRSDSHRRAVAAGLGVGVVAGAVFSLDLGALLVATASVLVHYLVAGWWMELSCDARAVRWSGVESLRAWAASQRLRRQPGVRPFVQRLVRSPMLLSHPPTALRVALYRRAGGPHS